MGFKAYSVTALDTGAWQLHGSLPVRFSGPTGLVALWCRAHKDALDHPWRVSPMEWLAMVLPPVEARRRWIVFEQEENGRVCYAQLLSITGIVSRQVELMFSLAPLVVEHDAPDLVVRPSSDGRIWAEDLALDGGPHSSTCSWRWTKPHLALGAAVVGRAGVAAAVH